MKNLKWQLHAETCITQIFLWMLMAKVFGGVMAYIAILFIAGNLVVFFKAVSQLPHGYYTKGFEEEVEEEYEEQN